MKKIVVVDHQPVLTSIYKAKFSAEGFHVDVASDGEQALGVIRRTNPDLLTLLIQRNERAARTKFAGPSVSVIKEEPPPR